MLKGEGADSQIVTLEPHHTKRTQVKDNDLPAQIKLRFVRVQLENGQYEVLVTNLLDETEFPTADFLDIYHMRWGVEGFYAILKTRLNLENFSGKTAQSIYQDFYSTVYLTGLETILTTDINDILAKKNVKHKQQVNHVVSFNAIKNQVFELLCSNQPANVVIDRLEKLFLTNRVSIRDKRKVPRQKTSAQKQIHYLKRQRKFTFYSLT